MYDLSITNTNSRSASRRERRRAFWRRQFGDVVTRRQLVFDVVWGLVLPILCFAFDPIVFGRDGIFGAFTLITYGVAAIEIVALAAWLIWGRRVGSWGSMIGGITLAGALVSSVIGLAILPFSLIGLIFIIGALGFTPFFTAFVFLRNGWRAVRFCTEHPSRVEMIGAALLGTAFVLGGPVAAQMRVSQIISHAAQEIAEGNPHLARLATERVKQARWFPSVRLDSMVSVYWNEADQERRERLAKAYWEITGENIEYYSSNTSDSF